MMPSTTEMRSLIATELSLPSRLGYTMLLLASLAGAGVTGALLATETGLPPRTQVALAVMVGIGLSWTAYAVWVLTRRRVLLAGHRIVAGRMAVGFTAVFTVGAWALGQWGGMGRTGFAAAGLGAVMLASAIAVLVHARRRFAELSRRRAALERELIEASR
jgi:hypothetical protein